MAERIDAPTGPGWWRFANSLMEAVLYFPKAPQDAGDPMMLSIKGLIAYGQERPYAHDNLVPFNGSWWSVMDWEGHWFAIPDPPEDRG